MDRQINNNTMGGVSRNTSRVLAPPGGRSNIFFGEDSPAPNTAGQTVVTPPVSAGPAATGDAAKTTKSSTDAFEDSATAFTRNKNKNTASSIIF